ncbi:ubiquitin carboxyl-terminal hydrolase 42-like [Melopsittacus undulatus]|uniref:ubiquitin carboxyl-terminal hydrolase 42-like n=1 Tax=Melopsittacus undulatus TaxID=13146 RepID=UPI00146ED669|nr:ubiquitin carboxyl-terminal hydrolase 42-like [Melopsittacus undulatus]
MKIPSVLKKLAFRGPYKGTAKKTKAHTVNLGPVPAEEDAEKVPRGSVYCRTSEKPKPFGQEELIVNDGIAPPQRILFPPEKIRMDWQQPLSVGVGLQNMGNTCYLNATLQCLTYTPPLANYMLSLEHSKSCQEKGFCMMCTLEAHINQALRLSKKAVKPMSVINGLRRTGKHFRYGRQEDAHEFLSFTVEALQKACLNGSTTLDTSSQATTLINQIFGGYLRSQVKCLNCKAVSEAYEPFLDITLDIETVTSVTEALEQLVKPEQLDGENSYKCSKCENMVPASKRYTIHRSSKVLIITLKRFSAFTGGKINKDVKYPEYLDLRAYMSQSMGEPLIYSLYAVLVHSGSTCNEGHYICFIKAGNGFWYRMNDAIVERSDTETVLNQQAYLLFYIRRYDLTLGEGGFYLPAPSYPRSFPGQPGSNSKQAGFMGPQLPPHMIKNSSRLNGNGPLKEDTNPVGTTIKRPSSAPPTACIQNWAMTSPSATDPSKAQKVTLSLHNKLPECQSVSQPGCLASALENEDLSKTVPSSTITNSFRAESTSNASTVAVVANISKQEVPAEMFVEPAVSPSPALGSDATVPSSAESSGKSEASNGVFKMNYKISSNGIVIWQVVGTLQNSCSFCESAEEERSHPELPQNDSLNGAISLDIGSKQNGLKLDDFACQVQPAKPSEIFSAETNGLLEAIPVAESPVPQEIILESLAYNRLNRSSEKTRVADVSAEHVLFWCELQADASGKCSRYRSRSRERTEQNRNRYYPSKAERTWSTERLYRDESRRWEKCRYYKDYSSVHGTEDGRERKYTHFDKDFDKLSQFYKLHSDYHCKSRWAHNTHCREEGAHDLDSHRGNFHPCSLPQQQPEKHSGEGHAPPPASAHAQFDNSFRENEKPRLGKRKHGDTEGSKSEVEKKRHQIDDKYQGKDSKCKAH